MATKRVHNIAKELGIKSQVIVDKCRAEGIPETLINGHMSVVSAGLEATIREWFADGSGSTSTAVETAAKVEVDKAKAKAPSRARKSKTESGADHPHEEHPGTSVETPAAPETHAEPVVESKPAKVEHKPEPKPEPKVEHKPEPTPEVEIDDHQRTTPIEYKPEPPRVDPRHEVRPSPPKLTPTVVSPVTPAPAAPTATPPQGGDQLRPAAAAPTTSSRPPGPGLAPPPADLPVRPRRAPTRTSRSTSRRARPTSPPRARSSSSGRPSSLPAPRSFASRPPSRWKLRVRAVPARAVQPPRPPARVAAVAPASPMTTAAVRRVARAAPAAAAVTAAPAQAPAARSQALSGQGVPQRRRASSGEVWVGGQVFSEQDIIEREARLLRAGGFLKKRKQDLKKGEPGQPGGIEEQDDGKVRIAAPFTIKDLSAATGVKGAEIVKKLFLQGVMATINSGIDPVKAQEIMMDFEIELEVVEAKSVEEQISESHETREYVDKRRRGPVVTILGHVDHGKTSLLDRIRHAKVAEGEAGGITQKTSAFKVPLKVAGEDKEIVFLDTPGHEAFTSMRSRGANMTDIVVLVVSAPEGVMPQTIESINHARAAEVPIVVALNKIDRPDATDQQIRKVLGQLAEANLNTTEWGGDVEIVRTSATTGQGVQELLEVLDYQAQLLELTADFGGEARGTVIEARTQEGRGPVANLLIQDGHLAVGDFIVAGRAFGRVRDMTDDKGNRIKEAFPPTPVQISGLDELPDAGDKFFVVDSLREAQEAAEQRYSREREQILAQPKVTLDSLFTNMSDKAVKEILIVLKADAQGSVDVLRTECEKVKGLEVKARVIHAAVGGITESDVLLAEASKGIVIGFNVIPSGKARSLAENKGVEIRTYDVIYNIMDDLKKAAEGLLAPELRQEVLGHAEVRQVFKISKVGSIAGCYITDGTVQRDALIRVTRNGIVIENDRKLEQLKRFKDDAKEVRMGMECGMKIVGYDDIKEGDILECYKQVEVKRTL